MTLEDFEKSLAQDKEVGKKDGEGDQVSSREKRKHRHHHHHHPPKRRHHDERDDPDQHKPKRSRRSENNGGSDQRQHSKRRHGRANRSASPGPAKEPEDEWAEKGAGSSTQTTESNTQPRRDPGGLKRDAWMEAPSALDVDYTQRGVRKPGVHTTSKSMRPDFELKIHGTELNARHLQDLAEGKDVADLEDASALVRREEVDYTFGDAGARWRMTRLRAVYREGEESGRDAEEVAVERYGDLRAFDEAREEQAELERRDVYGEGYVGKEKPSGELFREREVEEGLRRDAGRDAEGQGDKELPQCEVVDSGMASTQTVPLNQTALNRLKAQMMKAKLRGSSEAARLEADYNIAMSSFANLKEPEVVVLGAMESRMLAGSRKREVKAVENRRGRERGLVEENEDMSIEDMVREERRTRGQAGGDGQRFAERIAKDEKFDNDLDYMDENANKLAKRVQKSELNLKNMAISDVQKMNKILDNCPLCHHEDTGTPPIAPIVSLATRVYLTLPTEPEISDGGACIVPVQHRGNLMECDDDEWEEIRNFMKCLTRMYHDQGRDVIFYENAAQPQRKRHAAMEAVPLPYSLGETAPAFFKEAILSADEEWAQHKKLIDTLARAKQGLGKLAFRRSLVKEMPYFHVWFEIDGGLGHVVEDANRWPKGDLFAREVLGGMLDVEPDVIKRQGRWQKGGDRRLDGFRKRWRKFDWTKVLTEG